MQKLLVCAALLGLVACGGGGGPTRVAGGPDLSLASVGKVRVKITVAGQTYESSGSAECTSFNIDHFEVSLPGVDPAIRITCYEESWDTGIVDVGSGPAITVSAISGTDKTVAYKSLAFAPSGMQVSEVPCDFLGTDF